MLGFNGGLMGKKRTTSGSAAVGVWAPNEQSIAKRDGSWVVKDQYRYLKFSNFANTSLNADTFELAEAEFYDQDTLLTGITASSSFAWDGGSNTDIVNGNTADRSYEASWSTIQSSATLTFDFGSIKLITHLKLFISYGGGLYGPRFPASFTLSGSADNSSYTSLGTITIGTSLTEIAQDTLYASNKISILA